MILNEGGNVFKDADGAPKTQRINQADVEPTVAWLEKLTGLPLLDNMLGSTGQKPTSGDLDLAVDINNTSKEEALSALEVLGYSRKQSEKVIDNVIQSSPDSTVEALIKAALNKL